jgi:hypothetical protein
VGRIKTFALLAGGALFLYLIWKRGVSASSLEDLILVLAVVACFFFVRSYLRSKREREDRLAPPPEKAVIEVRVPKDMADANARMKRFYTRIAQTTNADPEMRRQGVGQLDILYIVERPPKQMTPVLRFFIVSDPQTMPTIKRALKTAFEKQAEVFVLALDPLSDIVEQLRSLALAELNQEGGEVPSVSDVDSPKETKEQSDIPASA